MIAILIGSGFVGRGGAIFFPLQSALAATRATMLLGALLLVGWK